MIEHTAFDVRAMPLSVRYRLLSSSVVPRPIAWITTIDGDGVVNIAPFSCFNLMGYDPPLVAIGVQSHPDGRRKDTYRNIAANRELVVNLVPEREVAAMEVTAREAPPGTSEADVAGIALAPSLHVAPPRIAAAPVSLECRLFEFAAVNDAQAIVIAEVISATVLDPFVIDRARGDIDTPAMALLGRMEGPGWYARCTDRVTSAGLTAALVDHAVAKGG